MAHDLRNGMVSESHPGSPGMGAWGVMTAAQKEVMDVAHTPIIRCVDDVVAAPRRKRARIMADEVEHVECIPAMLDTGAALPISDDVGTLDSFKLDMADFEPCAMDETPFAFEVSEFGVDEELFFGDLLPF
jgi:hypothetical protein